MTVNLNNLNYFAAKLTLEPTLSPTTTTYS